MHRHPLDAQCALGSILGINVDTLQCVEGAQADIPNDATKDAILPIEVRRRRKADEELATIGRRAFVGHAQYAAGVVSQRRADLVFKGRAALVDGRAGLGRLACRRARLDHEARDQTVEGRAIVGARCADGEEVLSSGEHGLA